MASVNQVNLLGNVTRDPQTKYTNTGTAICELGIAVNEKWKDKSGNWNEEVLYVDVVLMGRNAEIAAQYCEKGKSVHIEGKLKLDAWNDKETGQKRSRLKVMGNRLQLLGGNGKSDRQEQRSEQPSNSEPNQFQDGGTPDDVPF